MYICISKNEQGIADRAIYYSKQIGRSRCYRNGYPLSPFGLALFKYKKRENAQKLCDTINKALGENFEVYKEV